MRRRGSADPYNRSELHTATVAILTTDMQLAALPGNPAVPADANVQQIAADCTTAPRDIRAAPSWLE